MAGYCNTTTDLKQRGTYLNRSVPTTSNIDLEEVVDSIFSEINRELFKVGIVIPVSATFIRATAQLKFLNALGANAEIELGLTMRGTPTRIIGERGSSYLFDRFYRLLKEYCEFPEMLFEEDKNNGISTGAAYTTHKLVRPKGQSLYSAQVANKTKPSITMDDDF